MKSKLTMGCLCGLTLIVLTACASASYKITDGAKTTEVSYSRLLTTSDSMKATVPGANVEIGGQKIDAATLNALLGILGTAARVAP
jgi:hypothetical protein